MPNDWGPVSLDRDDDPFIWAARVGRAEYIISVDYRHMLNLGHYKNILIGRPQDFFDWVQIAHPMNN